jgi:hypothetical protein
VTVASTMDAVSWTIAAMVGVVVLLLGRTRWSKDVARRRGLSAPDGGPTRTALGTATLIGGLGIAVGIVTGSWIWFAVVGGGAAIGMARYALYRHTGTWR